MASSEYRVVYTSPAHPVPIVGPNNNPWHRQYTGQPPDSHGGGGWSCNEGSPPGTLGVAGTGSVECTGTITGTITWQGEGEMPSAVVIKETATALWNGEDGVAADGMGNFAGSSGTITTVRYSGITDPATVIVKSCAPYAYAEYYGEDPPAVAGVSYKVEVIPVEVMLGGGIGEPHEKKFLIGQLVTGTVVAQGDNDLTQTTWSWSVDKGEPFKDYQASDSLGVFIALTAGDLDDATLLFHFKKPESEFVRVQCQVHFAVPQGSLPSGGIIVAPHRDCLDKAPGDTLLVTVPGSTDIYYQGGAYWANLTPPVLGLQTVNPFNFGTQWSNQVTTPSEFGPDLGSWNITQLVTPQRTVVAGGSHVWSLNGLTVLDGMFPYSHIETPCNDSHSGGDAPGNELSSPSYTTQSKVNNETFTTYSMYKPPGEGSVYVPLSCYRWSWTGTADKINFVWTLSGANQGIFQRIQKFPPHPVWTQNVFNSVWVPPF